MLGFVISLQVSALDQISNSDSLPLPADISQVHFYLITVDVGSQVWDNFGHTALRVVDESNDTDTVFNWGLFDMSGGAAGFSFNFFKGIMNYQLGTSSPQREFGSYRQQRRSVWQDKINLSNLQKEILYKRLMWNLRPENVVYPYHYFFDNCTTRVRDYLDEAVMGAISAASMDITHNTFRDQVKSHYESLGLIQFSLDVLMNSNIDRRITQWEEMFLPLSLRSQLMGLPSVVFVGGERQNLLSDSTLIMEFTTPTDQVDPYYVASGLILVPVLFLLLMLRRFPASYFTTHSRINLRMPELSFRVMGILGLIVFLFSGVFGFLMLGGWFFSGHLDLYSNMNLLLFWPTDLLGLAISFQWLIRAKPWPLTHNTAPFVNYYWLARIVSIIAYGVIGGFGLSAQVLDSLLLYVVPGLFLFIVLVWIVGFEQAKSKNVFF